MDPARRRFLRTVAAVAGGSLLAGCQTGGSDGTPEATTTPTTTLTPTPTPGDGTDGERTRSPATLKRRAREFVRLLADGQFEQAHGRFTDRTAGIISVDRLERAYEGTVGQRGDFREITLTTYHGPNANGTEVVVVTAQFTDGTLKFEFGFAETGIAAFRITPATMAGWTPPSYADESAFTERQLTLSAPGECSLGATLTMPAGDGPVPGVVLVHGNGAQDRDETVGPNKTFKDIAWGLATRGIAVLRYDKRTYVCDVARANATIDDVVTEDALTAIDRLRAIDRVDDVFVAGHSFGGLLAPRIARRDGDLAGVVMLAPGPARPISDAIVAQVRHLVTLDGTVTDAEQRQLQRAKRMAEKIRTLDIGDDEVVNGLGGDEYYRSLREYDHREAIRSLSIPRFIAQGGGDWQVTVEEDLAIWRDAVAGEENVTIEVYPALDHHFQVSTGKETAREYRQPDSHVAKRLVVDVAAFVEATA